MKKVVMIISLMMAFSITLIPAAMADTISQGDYVKLIAYNPSGNAGIMTYAVSHDEGATVAFNYDSFCIQENVDVWLNQWYPVAAVSGIVGYVGPFQPGHGPLNGVVDYLFYKYTSGVYDTSLNNQANQADLQKLLWSLQGTGPSYTSSITAPWTSDMHDYNNPQNGLQHPWGTKVINIVSRDGRYDIQNQLYNQVPEPTTMLLLGLGLGLVGLAGVRRKIAVSVGRK